MPSLNSLAKFFILSLLIRLVAFQRVALKSQVVVSGDAHYIQPEDPVSALLSLQWRVDLDLPNRHARLSSIVALEYLPPGDEVRSSGLTRATAQLHRQYALPAGAGDEIRLPLHLPRHVRPRHPALQIAASPVAALDRERSSACEPSRRRPTSLSMRLQTVWFIENDASRELKKKSLDWWSD